MELKARLLKWSSGIPVAMLSKKTAKRLGIHSNERISLKKNSGGQKEIFTIVDISEGIVKDNELAISFELNKRAKLKAGQKIDINLANFPESLTFIKNKLNGKKLSKKEIDSIINDVVNNSLSEAEIALFVSAMYNQGMDMEEVVYLIESIFKTGDHFSFKNKFVVDKHSIGGIPGNRTTPIVVSICTSAGLIMPKSSSRAITSAAGTADVVEAVANIEFSIKELKKIVKKTNGCLVWGGSLKLVPADEKIIQIEKMIRIDPESQLLASIMSKKLASGSNYILIDIPYGKDAKVNKTNALKLKRKFEYLGRYFKKKLRVVLTFAREPIGNGIGPVLELIDIIQILDPSKKGPHDLRKKSLFLAGQILEMTGKSKKGKGIEFAEKILNSGKAFAKFKEIIKAQGGKIKKLKPGKFRKDILAKMSGRVVYIDNKKINSLARVTGCPIDKSAGIYIYSKTGNRIKKGEKIATIYSESESRLKQAVKFYENYKPIVVKPHS